MQPKEFFDTKTKNFVLGGYSDADFDGTIDDKASTSGYLMNMGRNKLQWPLIQQKQSTFQHGKQHVKLFGCT